MKIKHILFAVTAAGLTLVVTSLGSPPPAAATGTYYYNRLAIPDDGVTDQVWSTFDAQYPGSGIEVMVNEGSAMVPKITWPSECGVMYGADIGTRPLHNAMMRMGPGVGSDGVLYFNVSFDDNNDVADVAVFRGIYLETKVCCLSTGYAATNCATGNPAYAVYRGQMERL